MATKKTRKRSAKPKPPEELVELAEPEAVKGPVAPLIFGTQPFGAKVDLPADGTLIRMDGEPVVYVMHGGQRRPFASKEAFIACGFGWGDIIVLSPAEIDPIPVGPEVVRQGDL